MAVGPAPVATSAVDEGKEDPLINPKRWIIGSLIIGLGFLISIVFFSKSFFDLGVSGIIVFFAVLVGSDIFSGTTRLDTGEVRKAIAISFVYVYFMLMGFSGTTIANSTVIAPLLNNFWWIIAVIIGFYFGGRSAEEIVNIVKTRP